MLHVATMCFCISLKFVSANLLFTAIRPSQLQIKY